MKNTIGKGTSDARDVAAGHGPLFEHTVGAPVVAAVAVRAAAAVPGVVRVEPGLVGLVASMVRAARHRVTGLDPAPIEGARVELDRVADGHTVRVEVDVVISGQDQAAAVGRAVQRAVAGAVTEATGLTVAEVGVSIIDVVWDLDRP
ncbi:Asp23/Gls24 family envelope stress response protein [Actinophytocola xanthii]|uniref:Asp23/Gls24 family envelope stress response protein n=1 Tax=Actinophytocola xanthii TaxID=1912961 RepID=UPI0026C8DDB5